MGAIPFPGGVAFRVWAPFATGVCVAGGFNAWSMTASPLTSEGGGYWSTNVAGAAVGDEYKFVISPGGLWKNDPYARAMTSSAGNGIIISPDFIWTTQGYATPPWNEMVIYELHVGAFLYDPGSRSHLGDFATVIEKLDDLAELGINAIELMPSDEYPSSISFGYNPSDIFAVEANYGGPAGFQTLVDAAHARGIAVIYDVVYNHLGPDDLDLWRFDGWYENDGGGIYFYNDWRAATPWGPRPDYGRAEVRQFLRDNALFWCQQYRCDGLRFDSTVSIRTASGADLPDGWGLLQRINGELQAAQPWKITIAEDMQDDERLTRGLDAGGAGFGAQWGAGFVHALRGVVATPDDGARDMAALAGVIAQRFNANAFQRVIYSESHDEDAARNGGARLPEVISPGAADDVFAQKRSTLAAAVVFTAPGIPMIFMGQEFLESGAWSDSQPLDWSKATRFAGIRRLYRDLIRLRRNWFDSTRGLRGQNVHVHHVNDADKVIAYHRWDAGGPRDAVVVIANFGNRAYDSYRIGLPRDSLWRVRFNSDWVGYSPAFTNQPSFDVQAEAEARDGMANAGAVGLGPYTAVILSQDS